MEATRTCVRGPVMGKGFDGGRGPPVREVPVRHQAMGWPPSHTSRVSRAGRVLCVQSRLSAAVVFLKTLSTIHSWLVMEHGQCMNTHVCVHTCSAALKGGRYVVRCCPTPSLNPSPESLALNIFHHKSQEWTHRGKGSRERRFTANLLPDTSWAHPIN